MAYVNCWEFVRCGREEHGARADELGICPAALHQALDGTNHGRNAGRICWAVSGTFCGGVVQGTSAQKRTSCVSCEFFHLVEQEEGLDQLALLERGLVGAIGSDPRAAVPADGKLNCWEFKRCGREPGGARVAELGICPATSDESSDGLNGGSNGGRICWAVTGTLCKGQVQGSFAQKRLSCMSCDFYQLVEREEGEAEFAMLQPGRDF